MGADVYQGCENLPPFNNCTYTTHGNSKLMYRRTFTISTTFSSSDIYLWTQWKSDGSGVSFTYRLGDSGTSREYAFWPASGPPPSNVNQYFNIGYKYVGVTAKFFQGGVFSPICICKSGWSVLIKDPISFTKLTSVPVKMSKARSVQGNDAYWDASFLWGAESYAKSKVTDYDCAGNFPLWQVKYSYHTQTAIGGVLLWPC